ncbi:hypothetical protein CAL14_00375 [Bordetella genomosp. 9]|uniref:DUF2868 domain-containing protein n=1 Tax=Bordetella genomosp. 9 TaxID=1416803 RepID=UPI000A290A10|nr:DUF2868 domain-containing protein [Bordetella genomosp. 9]ARP88945.1 hypothetical protein CAL14_00375 [Bordetella genomosp. 9]
MAASESATFLDLWRAETVRLREEHWGPLEDQDAVRQARHAAGPVEARVIARARLIADREGLSRRMAEWRGSARLAASALLLLGVLAGAGAAWTALGDGSRVVNIVWAVGALLGLHALTFFLWLLSFAAGTGIAAAGLGRVWLWATRRLARGPDAVLPVQALLTLAARAGATRWLFGAISHMVWLAALVAALATLLAVLSTESYRFTWATTLLAPDAFVTLTRVIGWLPDQLGFPAPDADMVRLSDGVHAVPSEAQAQWGWWLIGLVAVYGVLPRLVAWAVSMLVLRAALRRATIDMALPGYAALRARLTPPAEPLGQEGAAPPPESLQLASAGMPPTGDQLVLAALELPDDMPWPPPVPPSIRLAGNLDSREQRHALLDALAGAPARRLLLACDSRQTPDRGTVALIADLAGKAMRTAVWLSGSGGDGRVNVWRKRLIEAGMPADAILQDSDEPLRWLEK